jgi:hypothetical protein
VVSADTFHSHHRFDTHLQSGKTQAADSRPLLLTLKDGHGINFGKQSDLGRKMTFTHFVLCTYVQPEVSGMATASGSNMRGT